METIIILIFFLGSFIRILPESPRWLLLKNRKKEAAQIIDGVYAKINKGNKIEATTELTARSSNEDVRVESSSSSENNETLDKSNENVGFYKKISVDVLFPCDSILTLIFI